MIAFLIFYEMLRVLIGEMKNFVQRRKMTGRKSLLKRLVVIHPNAIDVKQKVSLRFER